MKKRLFFPKLALQNMLRNRKFEFPYLLTGIFTVAMFYNMVFLARSKDIQKMPGSDALTFILLLGCVVVALFSVIFLLYTNSFLVKRRQKEFGLYNILGMEKRHIAHMMLWETVYICLITIVCGILVGILLSKLMLLFIFRMLFFTVHFGFEISAPAVIFTVLLFGAVYFVALLWNTLRVSLSKPVELLHASNAGEKEPKTKWIMAIVGLLSLGGGYYIALTTDSPLSAIGLFFFAVILVIVGTYCLFTAGSIAVLKLLKKNKKYYYNKKHFSAVSGMLYRMKQNAVGLANICILSTMVLVMISASVCLYVGADDAMTARFPRLISFYQKADNGDNFGVDVDEVRDGVRTIAAKNGRTISNLIDYRYLTFGCYIDGTTVSYTNTGNGHMGYVEMITAAGYAACNHRDAPVLADGEVLVCMNNGNRTEFDTLDLLGRSYRIKSFAEDVVTDGAASVYMEDTWFVVVKDDAALLDFCKYQEEKFSDDPGRLGWQIAFNIDGDEDEVIACYDEMVDVIAQPKEEIVGENSARPITVTAYRIDSDCRPASRLNFYAMYGGLLFLGIFLGALFLMATALIIYYKQISEGYDDRERFIIMQQVGMSRAEVKKTISSQILSIFFLPLIVAVIHLAGSFRIITKMFLSLNMTNVPLFALCALGTAIIFAVAYFVIYSLTARTYYRLVH